MKFKLLSLGVLIGAGLSGNSFAIDKNDFALQDKAAKMTRSSSFTEVVPGLINDHIRLGTAYNSDTKEFLNVQTVDGYTDTTFGNTSVITDLIVDGSYNDTLNVLNGKVDVDITFPVVRVDAGGHLAKEIASTEFSNSYTFQAYLKPKKASLKANDSNLGYTLTAAGNTLANNYQGQLMSLAGDSYISEIEYGAQLLVTLKVEYLSEQHKSDIGGYVGVDYGAGNIGINVDGQLRYIDEDLKKSVRISVRAVQHGGDPKQLLNIIPNNIITCSLDNYAPCTDMFNEATTYASEDFGSQFTSLSDYNVVRYTATKYGSSSLDVRRLDSADQEILFATTYRTLWLEDEFKKAVSHENRARSVLAKYSSWMTDAQRATAESIKQAAYDNAWIYNEYALMCRDNPYGTACNDNWSDFLSSCGTAENLPCEATYSLSDLSIEAGTLTPFFKCETAREASSNFGVEDEDTSLGLRNLSLAPTFVDASDPAAGATAWVPCKYALPTYGSSFE